MNRKFIISMSVAVIMSFAAAYADTTMYTDGLGRIHFLGRDGGNGSKYTNSAEQDLTRRLYEQKAGDTVNDETYNQHPLKNYENTFPGSRFNTSGKWRPKSEVDAEQGIEEEQSTKTTVTTTKGATDYSGQYQYGSTMLDTPKDQGEKTDKTTSTKTKKHWWNRNK